MQNKIKTNRQTANAAVIALLALLMAAAVVFGGMSVWGASAVSWSHDPYQTEIDSFIESYAVEQGFDAGNYECHTDLLGQSPYHFSVVCNVDSVDYKADIQESGFYLANVGNVYDLLFIPKASPFGEVDGKEFKGVSMGEIWDSSISPSSYPLLHSNGKGFRETEHFYVACVPTVNMENFFSTRNYIVYVYDYIEDYYDLDLRIYPYDLEIYAFFDVIMNEVGVTAANLIDETTRLSESPYLIRDSLSFNETLSPFDAKLVYFRLGQPKSISYLFIPKKSPFGNTIDDYVCMGISITDSLKDLTPFKVNGEAYLETEHYYVRRFNTSQENSVWEKFNIVYLYGSPLPEDPVKEGHTFVGWYFDEKFTQPYEGQTITADTTLYAKFEIHTFTVTFNSKGGSEVESQVVNWHEKPDLKTPERTGYSFLGWFYADGKQYDGDPIEEDITLIAKWEVKMFKVTFMVYGEVYEEVTVAYGTSFQEAMSSKPKLYFMNLLNTDGIKIAKSGIVTADVTVPVGEMTTEEKVATFIGNNWWLLILGGSLIVAGILATVIASLVAYKRK